MMIRIKGKFEEIIQRLRNQGRKMNIKPAEALEWGIFRFNKIIYRTEDRQRPAFGCRERENETR